MEVRYTMTANGQDASVLQSVIEARRRELGETTRQAATATAIQVLKSLRGNTKIADPEEMNLTVKVASGFVVGWKKQNGHTFRCVRVGSRKGMEVSSRSVKDIAGKCTSKDVLAVYSATDIVQGSKEKTMRYLIVAKSEKDAREYACLRHKNRVRRYSGMARFALTVAMMQTATKGTPDKAISAIGREGKAIAFQNVQVQVRETGFEDGKIDIDIHDALQYATKALKGGEGFVQQAVMNASNGIVGMINHKLKIRGSFHKPLKIPFPKE